MSNLERRLERQNNGSGRRTGVEPEPQTIIVRLEDLPATPRNIERIRERVQLWNSRLESSETPFRLRMI